MVGRLLDIILSFLALVLLFPLLGIAAMGIRIASAGPIIYRGSRVGLNGKLFTIYKLRTMHIRGISFSSTITARNDPRVFRFGSLLRRYKIDELPQLLNILKGDMSFVGPRPEDPHIVRQHYASVHRETLGVLPGLVSPGSIYNYTHGEQLLEGDDPAVPYVEHLLPIKLALDIVYVREASFSYNLRIIIRTIWVIACIVLGKRNFPNPPEMERARLHIHPAKGEKLSSLLSA